MPRVTVRVYATLIEQAGWRVKTLELEERATVVEALKAAGLSKVVLDEGRLRPMYKVLVNGRDVEFAGGLSLELKEGDTIDVFPPVAGGSTLRQIPSRIREDTLGAG